MEKTVEKRKVLGRGIASLIPAGRSVDSAAPTAPALQEHAGWVPLESIFVNPHQPRKHFSEKALQELADSVREKGVLQPILVSRRGDHFELIAGERRYRAAKLVGLKQVPVRIIQTNPQEQLEIALIENLMREDLNPIEEALGYEKLQKQFQLTHEQISQKVSKDRTTITNALRLLKLPITLQQEVSRGTLTMGHARALLSLEKETLQISLAQGILKNGLSVRQTEQLAAKLSQAEKSGEKPKIKSSENPNLTSVREEIQRRLGTKVEIKARSKDKGEIRIQYFSADDLHRILTHLQR